MIFKRLSIECWVSSMYFLFAFQRVNPVGTSNAELTLADPEMYQLDITLKRGHNLAARDRRGKKALVFL